MTRELAICSWDDRESMERFLRSDLFEATNPDFLDVESEGFAIGENFTALGPEVGRRRTEPAPATLSEVTVIAGSVSTMSAVEIAPDRLRRSR